MGRKTSKRRKRRPQSAILASVVKALGSGSGKGQSIRSVARKSGTTWRTAETHIDALKRAGLVETVRRNGTKRKKYKLKRLH